MILFLSTTLSTAMTRISLHMYTVAALEYSQREQFFCYGSNFTPRMQHNLCSQLPMYFHSYLERVLNMIARELSLTCTYVSICSFI
jgi:hypothetical protein